MKKNQDRICGENDTVFVEQRDYQIMQHAFENNEVTSQVRGEWPSGLRR